MPFDSLGAYWPETFIPPGRRWIVENVSDGVISRFDAVLDIEPGDFENERFGADSAAGSLAFENASIDYLRPMPPVTGVSGTGRFNGEALALTMSGGRIAGITASRGTAVLSEIHSAVPRMSVEIEAEGPAADALDLLDHPRLALVSKVGLEPVGVGGAVHTLFALELPMLQAIEPEEVDVNAVARVRDARMANIAGMADMTEGALRLGVDNASMELRGTARLQGMPAAITWRENFGDDAPFARRLDVTTTLTPEAQAALGFDMAPYVQGTLALEGEYTDPGGDGDATHDAPRRCDGGARSRFRSCTGPSPQLRLGRYRFSPAFLRKGLSSSPGSRSRRRRSMASAGPYSPVTPGAFVRSRSRGCGTARRTSQARSQSRTWSHGSRLRAPVSTPDPTSRI